MLGACIASVHTLLGWRHRQHSWLWCHSISEQMVLGLGCCACDDTGDGVQFLVNATASASKRHRGPKPARPCLRQSVTKLAAAPNINKPHQTVSHKMREVARKFPHRDKSMYLSQIATRWRYPNGYIIVKHAWGRHHQRPHIARVAPPSA